MRLSACAFVLYMYLVLLRKKDISTLVLQYTCTTVVLVLACPRPAGVYSILVHYTPVQVLVKGKRVDCVSIFLIMECHAFASHAVARRLLPVVLRVEAKTDRCMSRGRIRVARMPLTGTTGRILLYNLHPSHRRHYQLAKVFTEQSVSTRDTRVDYSS